MYRCTYIYICIYIYIYVCTHPYSLHARLTYDVCVCGNGQEGNLHQALESSPKWRKISGFDLYYEVKSSVAQCERVGVADSNALHNYCSAQVSLIDIARGLYKRCTLLNGPCVGASLMHIAPTLVETFVPTQEFLPMPDPHPEMISYARQVGRGAPA